MIMIKKKIQIIQKQRLKEEFVRLSNCKSFWSLLLLMLYYRKELIIARFVI